MNNGDRVFGLVLAWGLTAFIALWLHPEGAVCAFGCDNLNIGFVPFAAVGMSLPAAAGAAAAAGVWSAPGRFAAVYGWWWLILAAGFTTPVSLGAAGWGPAVACAAIGVALPARSARAKRAAASPRPRRCYTGPRGSSSRSFCRQGRPCAPPPAAGPSAT